jgi:hypothetical protein
VRFGNVSVLAFVFSFLAGPFGTPSAPGGDDILHERVFGPELPDPYKHPACFTELANGDLYLVYYGGSGEYGDDTWVRGSRFVKGATHWTRPAVIADTPFRSGRHRLAVLCRSVRADLVEFADQIQDLPRRGEHVV